MIDVFDTAIRAAREALSGQIGQQINELNAAADALNSAQVAFNGAMTHVARLRADADKRQADAVRAMDTAATNTMAIILALKQQLGDGAMVTGTDPLRIAKAAE